MIEFEGDGNGIVVVGVVGQWRLSICLETEVEVRVIVLVVVVVVLLLEPNDSGYFIGVSDVVEGRCDSVCRGGCLVIVMLGWR